MSRLRAACEKARDQFKFYAKCHLDKLAPGFAPLTPQQEADTRGKAAANEQLALEMQMALDAEPFDVLELEKVQDYRFASMIKGKNYSFARGLTINPTHLPAALDAILQDGFELVSMFGDPKSDKMGFVFRHRAKDTDPSEFSFEDCIDLHHENDRLRKRVNELLGHNNATLEAKRESDRKLKAFLEGAPLEELRGQD